MTWVDLIRLVCIANLVYVIKARSAVTPVCCTPDQWEGFMMAGEAGIIRYPGTLYMYYNHSIQVAYDFTNLRSYMLVNSTVHSLQTSFQTLKINHYQTVSLTICRMHVMPYRYLILFTVSVPILNTKIQQRKYFYDIILYFS